MREVMEMIENVDSDGMITADGLERDERERGMESRIRMTWLSEVIR